MLARAMADPARTAPLTILIVDDREPNLLALEAVLEPLGERLVKARSGREALRFLLHDDCALVLLDVQMPDLDGFETAALIRERERTRYTPIIFVTAVRREEEEILKGYAKGAVDYVVKPFAAEAMVAKVRFFLDQNRREQSLRQEAAQRTRERDELEQRERRARAEAEAHREHLYALFRKAPAAIAILRGPGLVFVLANPKFEELVGRKDLVGKRGREAIADPAASPTWEILENVQRTGDPHLGTEYPGLWGVSDEGRTRYFNFVAQPTKDVNGAMDTVMVHAVDVTDTVEARQKTEALARQLLDSDRSKDEFLAVLGHELRNPLAPILTALHIMRLRATDDATERERAVIERQVSHLSRLVDDLLDVSRATMGKIDLRRERVDVSTAVARAVEMSRPLLESKNHRLDVSVPVGALFVDGDVVRLAQVLGNLIQNAAKYTDPGGHIEIEGTLDGAEVAIRVRDDGQGIPADRLPAMFELFVQGDQSPERSQGGLGVGLTLVRSLVQLHGGRVDARSDGPGRGSEFVIRLPAVSEQVARGPERRSVANPGQAARRVLIVDDDVDATEMLADALRAAGHEVREEHDGASALVAAAQFQPDVVLLDLGLPGMDGIEVARRLRSYPQLGDVRIVALTGFGQKSAQTRSAAVGIESLLVKPVDMQTIMDVVTGAVSPVPSA
ncbi:MAG: response regulator [Deltaproteobacteria bacterium]|nr:MAG: response regulator [Deltaproteobacteria bacterium]